MNKEILERLNEIRQEAMNVEDAERATTLLQKLSVILGNISSFWITSEMEYNKKYEECTHQFEKISEARAKAKASDEYERKLRAEALVDTTKELINSLKYLIKLKIIEKQESRYQ